MSQKKGIKDWSTKVVLKKHLAYQGIFGPQVPGTWIIVSCAQSQASVLSISTSALEANGGFGSANSPMEFVNHGLLLWNQTRQRWVGNGSANQEEQQMQEPKLRV